LLPLRPSSPPFEAWIKGQEPALMQLQDDLNALFMYRGVDNQLYATIDF
jgi:hypothetical protein